MTDMWLKLNNHVEIIGSLNHLLEAESFVDVTFAVEGHQLKAHRLILSAYSPYLSSILKENQSPHPVIFMRDVKYVDMKAIIDFIYKGKAFVTQDNIQSVLSTAEALQITGLSGISWVETNVDYSQSADSVCSDSNCAAEASDSEETKEDASKSEKDCGVTERGKNIDSFPVSDPSEPNSNIESGSSTTVAENNSVRLIPQQEVVELAQECPTATKVLVTEGDTVMILAATPAPARPHPPGRQYTKEDLQQALEVIRQGRMGIKPAARAFHIPVATLHHAARRRNIISPMQQGGNHVATYRQRGQASGSQSNT